MENKIQKDFIFLGNLIGEDILDESKDFSRAANLFQKKLVEFILPSKIVTLLPIFYKKKTKFPQTKDHIFVNSQSGFGGKINYLYRFVFDTIRVSLILMKAREKNILFYNLDLQNVLIVFFSKFILRRKTYVILADYANFGSNSITNSIFNKIFRSMNGLVVLNSNIKCNDNRVVVPGLVREAEIVRAAHPLNKNVILSGSLGETTGFELALKTFSALPNVNLYITGRPFRYTEEQFSSLIKKYVEPSPNIKFLGLLPLEDYKEVLGRCDIGLSLRNPNESEHSYNFPSKILEYLAGSKLVISSLKYDELPEDLIYKCSFDTNSLSSVLQNVLDKENDEIQNLRKKIEDYLMSNLTEVSFREKFKSIM